MTLRPGTYADVFIKVDDGKEWEFLGVTEIGISFEASWPGAPLNLVNLNFYAPGGGTCRVPVETKAEKRARLIREMYPTK